MRRFRGCTCTGYRRVSDERAAKAALAVAALVGEEAARGLSANVVSRLKRVWGEEYGDWCRRDLSDDWVYVWADGIHSGLRGDDGCLCVLVVIGVNARGDKHFLAIEDGVRESTQSWREVLLGMKQRGFTRPAKLAVGDGALGFWSALSEVYPETRSQRCWMHKTGNVLNYFPKSGQPKAKQGLQTEILDVDANRLAFQLRCFPIVGKQRHRHWPRIPLQHLDRPAPGRPLAVVDLAEIEHLPLHHTPVAVAAVLDHAPVTVLLAVLETSLGAHEHGSIACSNGPPNQGARSALQPFYRRPRP